MHFLNRKSKFTVHQVFKLAQSCYRPIAHFRSPVNGDLCRQILILTFINNLSLLVILLLSNVE